MCQEKIDVRLAKNVNLSWICAAKEMWGNSHCATLSQHMGFCLWLMSAFKCGSFLGFFFSLFVCIVFIVRSLFLLCFLVQIPLEKEVFISVTLYLIIKVQEKKRQTFRWSVWTATTILHKSHNGKRCFPWGKECCWVTYCRVEQTVRLKRLAV